MSIVDGYDFEETCGKVERVLGTYFTGERLCEERGMTRGSVEAAEHTWRSFELAVSV